LKLLVLPLKVRLAQLLLCFVATWAPINPGATLIKVDWRKQMEFVKAVSALPLAFTLCFGFTANAAHFLEQWALENRGQRVCNFRGEKCFVGNVGVDIKHKQVAAQFGDCSAVISAVLDSGVDTRHPDLASNLLQGKNFVGELESNDPTDDNLHGTHVVGIMAASGSESKGVVGVCRKARILPVKVGNAEGFLTDADILEGIKFAVSSGARVVNGSFGGERPNALIKNAIQAARNTLFLFAAGNGDRFTGAGFDIDKRPTFPAAYGLPNIVTVAATDSQDRLGRFSNFGTRHVQLAAPGVNILSTMPMKKTASMEAFNVPVEAGAIDGTSMATPYVAGAATMLLARFPRMTVAQAKSRLLSSVDKIPSLEGKVQSGGRLNLAKLMGVTR
jgi:thermitase